MLNFDDEVKETNHKIVKQKVYFRPCNREDTQTRQSFDLLSNIDRVNHPKWPCKTLVMISTRHHPISSRIVVNLDEIKNISFQFL